jgi:hypothetical protein
MSSIHVDAIVCLKEDEPTHSLRRGAKGVVVSVWLSPSGFLCEVEFSNTPPPPKSPAVRALLRAQQLDVVE